MSQTRRLAAILAADVAGYSRLMGADEEGTLERLKGLRRELVDLKIAEHRGRIVKTTGDGMLVEFASVVDAVRCAVAVQQAMPERNTGVGAESRIELRALLRLSARERSMSAMAVLMSSPHLPRTSAALVRTPASSSATANARSARATAWWRLATGSSAQPSKQSRKWHMPPHASARPYRGSRAIA